MIKKFILCCWYLVLLVWVTLHVNPLHAANVVTLVAGERPPYIGATLLKYGYAFELVEEAFKRKSYQVNIKFVPWARARMLSETGQVDGILPIEQDGSLSSDESLVLSDPFPGGVVGFLKKKSLPLVYPKDDPNAEANFIQSLRTYRIGAVRGGVSISKLAEANLLTMEMVSADVINLDKLGVGRIQLALMDKYSAADLMVGLRPNLIGQLDFVTWPSIQKNFHVAFSPKNKNQPQLVKDFNDGLAEMERDGTLEKILNKHGFFQTKKTKSEKIKITIGTVNNSDMMVMQRLSSEFEKQNPNIAIDWRVLDESTLRLRLLSDLAIADGQFDAMMIGAYEVPLWAARGWLMPLQGLSEKYEVSDLIPAVRAGLSHEGQLFALPFYAESSMTYYRTDLFAKAGITMPQQPNYSDILRFASKIHDPAAGVYGICLRGKAGWGENMALLSTMVNAFGGQWFDMSWHPLLDGPLWKEAVSFYIELLKRYGPPSPERNGFNENLALFSQGHCGMWIDATVAAGTLFDAKRSLVSDRLGYVAAPVSASGKTSGWLWSWALAIPNSSMQKKETQQFIAWATSKEYIQSVANNFGWLGVPSGTRKSTYANRDYLKAAPFSQFVLSSIESADVKNPGSSPTPYSGIQYVGIPEFPAIGNLVALEIEKVLRREQSVNDALGKSQIFVEEQMRRSGYFK